MSRIGVLRVALYPFRSLFGSGMGNISLLRRMYKWVVATMLPERWIVVDANGYKLGMVVGGTKGMDSLAAGLVFGNGYEVEATKLFKSIVKQGMNVVDVGAHIGYYTLLASKLVGDGGGVWAFEPEMGNYNRLDGNVKLNEASNVTTIRQALGDYVGHGKLYTSDGMSGECSLFRIPGRSNREVSVDVTTMDKALSGQRVDVIKIDVDGGEMGVLLGAKNVIRVNPNIKIFTELYDLGLKSAGYSCKAYINELRRLGFGYIYLIDEKEKTVRESTLRDISGFMAKAEGVNLLCSKKRVLEDFVGLIPRSIVKPLPMRVQERIKVLCGLMRENDNVLDVGCGTGEYVTNAIGHLPVNVTAIDCDGVSIDYARRRNRHSNIKYLVGFGESFASDEWYDLIICSHVLEHNLNPKAILLNLRRLLKDDGVLYVAVPNGFGDFEVENFVPRMLCRTSWGRSAVGRFRRKEDTRDSMNADSQHVQFFTYRSITGLLEQVGFRISACVKEEFLGGVVTSRVVSTSPLLTRWNVSIAKRMPLFMVNSWMFICSPNGKFMLKGEKAVREYWDTCPCGVGCIGLPEGTRGFFDAVVRNRERWDSHIVDYVDYGGWAGKNVLDVGCGIGGDLCRFAEGGARVVGIDIAPRSVELSRKRLALCGCGGVAIEASAENIPYRDNLFDFVFSWGVLHHVADIQRAIREIYRVLKPNAEFCVMLYHRRSLVALQMYVFFGLLRCSPFRSVQDIIAGYHESVGTKAYTVKEARRMFAGFRDVSVEMRITSYDLRYTRNKFLPLWIGRLMPQRLGWNMIVKGRK